MQCVGVGETYGGGMHQGPRDGSYELSQQASKLRVLTCVIITISLAAGHQIYKSQIQSSANPPAAATTTAYITVIDPISGSTAVIPVTGVGVESAVSVAIEHLNSGEFERARAELESAVASGEKSYEAFFALAATYETLGRYADALANYSLAATATSTPEAAAGRARCETALSNGGS